jgi:nucleotide-binding universal stress UspA family protein
MSKYQRIVVPLDGSELAERAIAPAVTIAYAMAAEVILLSVVTPLPPRVDPFSQALRKEIEAAKPYLELARAQFLPVSVDSKATVIVGTEIARSIINFVEQNKVDLIVMSSQGRSGPSRRLYGSVVENVLRGASCDTAIIHAQVDIGPSSCKRILVPLDGSPSAEQALEPAIEIARSLSAELVLLRAVSIPLDRGETVSSPNFHELMAAEKEAQASSYLQKVREHVTNDRLQIKTITASGRPSATIIGQTKKLDVDLIVMTSRGQSGIRRRLYGSVAEKVLFSAACPTLVVREPLSVHKEEVVCIKGV